MPMMGRRGASNAHDRKRTRRQNKLAQQPRAARPTDVIELWSIDRPRDSESNARTHPKKQIEELRYSLRQYGQVWPILVRPDGEIVAGHARRIAAKLEGMTTIKVLVARGWTEAQCRQFALLDNRVPMNAGWDAGKLALELEALRGEGVSGLKLGFSAGDLARLLPTEHAQEANAQTFEPIYQVLIECASEREQLRVLTKLQKDSINCRALIA